MTDDLIKVITEIRDSMIERHPDAHTQEIAIRAHAYALNRIVDGSATTEKEAKHAFAAFADGFCTGTHVATGIPCTR